MVSQTFAQGSADSFPHMVTVATAATIPTGNGTFFPGRSHIAKRN